MRPADAAPRAHGSGATHGAGAPRGTGAPHDTEARVRHMLTHGAAPDAVARLVADAAGADGLAAAQHTLLASAAQCAKEARTSAGAERADRDARALLVVHSVVCGRHEALTPAAVAPAVSVVVDGLASEQVPVVRRALACVAVLAQRNAKDLVAYWPALLAPESPALTACLAGAARADAAHALGALFTHGQGFWAMARDSARPHTAFETHSERLARMLDDVRMRLARLLCARDGGGDVVPLLRLVGVLLDTTGRVPLHTSHTAVLWAPVAQCAAHRSCDTRLAAYDALAGMQPAADTYAAAATRAATDLLDLLDARGAPPDTAAHAWRLLARFVARTDAPVPAPLLPRLSRDVGGAPVAVRRGAVEMLAALARRLRRDAAPAVRAQLPALVARAAHDPAADVRVAVGALWAEAELGAAPAPAALLAPLHALLRDADASVRAAAVRAVGARMEQAARDGAEAAALVACLPPDAVRRAVAAPPAGLVHDAEANVRVCAAWALANYAAVLAHAPPAAEDGTALLAAALPLPRDEREAAHAVRTLGALLGLGVRARWWDAAPRRALYVRGVDAACAALGAGRAPKLRWNAVAALARALPAPAGAAADAAAARGVDALVGALGDRTFKVQRMAAQALAGVLAERPGAALSAARHAALCAAVDAAQASLAARVQSASFGEVQMHAAACAEALARLRAWAHAAPGAT
ncbi:hypothetical protein MBRA1_003926 [Malassezia brasiliensis]|uniref:DUF4042 domain-containing protein n=1 Tax=Malassezia brasiliensis TaxID=1821822 RepID=A0AAF0IQD8_9BASI|nr:hypothetical protein MBRA1_003926 [Malassezia brasiliensis]